MQEPDREDGKRGCFVAHQRAARAALELGATTALTFEDDVVFLPHFGHHAAGRAAAFLRAAAAGDGTLDPDWSVFFLGHFPRKMELAPPALGMADIVRVRSYQR